MTPRRLVVFDLDGTLVDSRRDLADSANEMLTSFGAEPLSEDAVGRMVGGGAAQLVARALAAAKVTASLDDALSRFLASYDTRLTHHTRPYPGIPEMLAELAARQTGLALLTNKPLNASIRILESFQLAGYFRHCVGGDGPWPRKPAPDGLRFLMTEESAAPAQTVLVGDSGVDLQTARNAGVRICLAGYGFGFEDLDRSLLTGDDVIADAPGRIAQAVS